VTPRSPDERLTAEIARLPEARAPEGFTRRVLERLEAPPRRRRATVLRWAAAAGALALTVALLAPHRSPPDREVELAARTEALRREHEALRRELEALRELADEAAPVLYIDGDERYDYVVDLRPMLAATAAGRSGAVPAMQRTDTH